MKNKMNAVLKIQAAKELYLIMSKCTKLPYVNCNEDTCDDEVFVFLNEDAGKNVVTELAMKDELVDLIVLPKERVLGFFSSLFSMGVNAVHIDKGVKGEILLQLTEVVQRPDASKLPEGKVIVENPSFQLTAVYFMQKTRAGKLKQGDKEELELREEMMVHFWEGKLIMISDKEQGKLILLNDKDGKKYQPVFTDIHEYQKFLALNKNHEFKMSVVEAKKAPLLTAQDANGIAVNPFSVNLKLDIARKKV